ncbi:hypothetical protein [Actinoplanes philippinensis]|uniref:hypothetical protein n=1 Tax=Actinoplanes philippinensis TaxID=35752 RepID=UPI0015A65A64|nr:hypothetical protein [Actinoplanes philippinensis]
MATTCGAFVAAVVAAFAGGDADTEIEAGADTDDAIPGAGVPVSDRTAAVSDACFPAAGRVIHTAAPAITATATPAAATAAPRGRRA